MRSLLLATQYCDLLAQREVLDDEARLRSEASAERADDHQQELKHDAKVAEVVPIVTGESARAAA
jgi:hypothetical protein